MEKMGDLIVQNSRQKEIEYEKRLLKNQKQKEDQISQKEKQKQMEHKKYQRELRGYLALQVQEKKRIEELEAEKNKYFIDREIEIAQQKSQEDLRKLEERKKKEKENVEFLFNQIEERRCRSITKRSSKL